MKNGNLLDFGRKSFLSYIILKFQNFPSLRFEPLSARDSLGDARVAPHQWERANNFSRQSRGPEPTHHQNTIPQPQKIEIIYNFYFL